MAEYSRMVQGLVSSAGAATEVVLPFVPDFIEVDNLTAATTPSNGGVAKAIWYQDMGQGAALEYVFNATPVLTTAAIAAGGAGFSTFSGSSLGASIQISGITKANPAEVTTGSSHGYATGDVVVMVNLRQSTSTGMLQIAAMVFSITVTGATTFTIPWNTNQSNYTALSGSPSGAVVRKINGWYSYFPGVSVISAITLGATTTVSTTYNHNFVVGQKVSFFIDDPWGTTELTGPNSSGQSIVGRVTAVNSALQFVCDIDSSAMTTFDSNPTFAAAQAVLQFPIVYAVGDDNTGSVTNAFLPTPMNALTVGGAFQNNTTQGFVIGASIAGSSSDQLFYRAYLHDLVN